MAEEQSFLERFLSPEQRQYLAQKLDRMTPQEEDGREWNDAR